MVAGSPCMCMSTAEAPVSATAATLSASPLRAVMSFTIRAPAELAARITAARRVSTETTAPAADTASITGTTPMIRGRARSKPAKRSPPAVRAGALEIGLTARCATIRRSGAGLRLRPQAAFGAILAGPGRRHRAATAGRFRRLVDFRPHDRLAAPEGPHFVGRHPLVFEQRLREVVHVLPALREDLARGLLSRLHHAPH